MVTGQRKGGSGLVVVQADLSLVDSIVFSEGDRRDIVFRHEGSWDAERDGPRLLAAVRAVADLVERSDRRGRSVFRDGDWAFVMRGDHDPNGVMDPFHIAAVQILQPLGIHLLDVTQPFSAGA